LVIRKKVWLVSVAVAATLLVPGSAAAKGSTLRFEQEQYAPDDRAVAHALVETWPGSGQPEDAPFAVYLVRGGQPLWFGHLPADAVPVGELRIGRQVPDATEVGGTYRVRVPLDVPRVLDGRYAVWVCAPGNGGKGCLIGFGDLVYGRFTVAASAPSPAMEARPVPGAPDPPMSGAASSSGGFLSWAGLAVAVGAVAALTALVVRRRHRRASA
jgi:hypothetical protein